MPGNIPVPFAVGIYCYSAIAITNFIAWQRNIVTYPKVIVRFDVE